MGYTVLMQWTATAPPPKAAISDLIFSRLLEHYDFNFLYRTTIQLRTFKATFPNPDPSSSTPYQRSLTTVIYSNPIYNSPMREVSAPQGARDDTAYLFLDDPAPSASAGPSEPKSGNGPGGEAEGSATASGAGANGGKNGSGLDTDGFEIVEQVDLTDDADGPAEVVKGKERGKEKGKEREKEQYQALAVRPAGSVMSLLQNLGSQFVIGLTKSARAAASTTAQQATATALAGQSFLLSSITFHPITPTQNPIVLTIHNLPSPNSGCIVFEAEWDGRTERAAAEPVLREFLAGCVPDGLVGETKVFTWTEEEKEKEGGWEGIERSRRSAYLLARCLRESKYI